MWYVLKFLHLFSGVRELETGLAAGASQLDGIKLNLEAFEFDTCVGILGIEVMVPMDLTGESPVVVDEESVVE